MKSKANAVFISTPYSQEVGDTNWNEYQTVITANNSPNQITIRTSDTTSNVLAVTSGYADLVQGSTIYLSNNGTTLTQGTIGVITSGTVKANNNTKSTLVSTWSSSTSTNNIFGLTSSSSSSAYAGANFIKPDGTLVWIRQYDGSIKEWKLNVPWNPASAVNTGKSISSVNLGDGIITGGNQFGFCFSHDGKYLYRVVWAGLVGSGTATNVVRNTLSTPWDISTMSNAICEARAISFVNSGTNSATGDNRCMRISKDGTKIIIFHHNSGSVRTSILAKPWSINSYTTSISGSIPSMPSQYTNYEVSEDGKTWYAWLWISTTRTDLYIGSFSTAWDASTAAISKTIPLTGMTGSVYNDSSVYPSQGFISRDGKYTWLYNGTIGGGFATYNLDALGGDAAKTYNIDITSFGQTQAPNTAWLAAPNVYIATAQTASKILMQPFQIDLDTITQATTTSAVVGIDGTGRLSAGDTVLLNGTTEVTLTSVVETANGLSERTPLAETGYIRYYNQSLQTVTASSLGDQTIYSASKMRFSNNGHYLYIIGDSNASYGPGLYQYYLLTPWDVSTGKLADFCYIGQSILTGGLVGYSNSYTLLQGFDINPNGTSFFVAWGALSASFGPMTNIYNYVLAKPHDLNSISAIQGPYNPGSNLSGSSSYSNAYWRYNEYGNEVGVAQYSGSSVTSWRYHSLGTPYDWTTFNLTLSGSTAAGTLPSIDFCFTPSGNNILTLGQTNALNGYLGMQATNSSANGTFLNLTWDTKITATGNNVVFPAGSGLTSTTALRSIDVSPDGTQLYVMTKTGVVYQFAVRLKTLTKYEITYPTQASPPTSVWLPGKAIKQTLTPQLDSANNTIVYTSNYTSANARVIQYKLEDVPGGSEVTQVRINLNKSQ